MKNQFTTLTTPHKYLNLQELNGTILRELVEKIVVHEKVKEKNDKGKIIKTIQQDDIYIITLSGLWR